MSMGNDDHNLQCIYHNIYNDKFFFCFMLHIPYILEICSLELHPELDYPNERPLLDLIEPLRSKISTEIYLQYMPAIWLFNFLFYRQQFCIVWQLVYKNKRRQWRNINLILLITYSQVPNWSSRISNQSKQLNYHI